MTGRLIALCTCMMLLLTACTPPSAPPPAQTTSSTASSTAPVEAITDRQLAEAVSKVYETAFAGADQEDEEWLTAKRTQELIDALAPSGVVAVGYHNRNRNTEQLLDLVATAKAGGSGEAVVCQNFRRDAVVVSRFVVDAGKVTVTDRTLTPSTKTFEPYGDPDLMEYFEIVDDYLIYAQSKEGPDDNSGGRGFRVQPLSDELLTLCDQYLDTVSNLTHWLLTEWTPSDISNINWDYFYEWLLVGRTGMDYANLPGMPAESSTPYALPGAEVEAVLTAAFPVTVEQLRATEQYRSSDQTYQFLGFRGGGYSGNQEVTAVRKNNDGSLTLTISMSAVDFGRGADPYCELTILPDGKGGCKYLSNQILHTVEPDKH